MDTEKIKEIMKLFEQSSISSMDVQDKDFKIKLEKNAIPVSISQEVETKPVEKEKKTLNSPLVGTFYASNQPGQEPLVKIGQHIHSGDVICIIEAMKVMNELKADKEGVITEILVQDGQMVEYDQALFVLGE
ncbi:acetyl-CoA carboxylase biotin carboxyl carrier protein [Floccifex sp.]|uniref:acetyl-CoA carboxylase biotin carboxyl carrier protein n=1 Tax=Floccifex sp. TaxID=2815810 RepID=UPI003F0CDCD2